MQFVKLYHATSEFSWTQIREAGFIGMTPDLLLSYVEDIFDLLTVPEGPKREVYYDRVRKELQEYAPGGMVSFFPDIQPHMAYFLKLGPTMGESFGHTLKQAIKYASRVTRTSYPDNLLKFSYLTESQSPVLLEVDVPIDLLANPEVIGTSKEHYTFSVVPVQYVVAAHFLISGPTPVPAPQEEYKIPHSVPLEVPLLPPRYEPTRLEHPHLTPPQPPYSEDDPLLTELAEQLENLSYRARTILLRRIHDKPPFREIGDAFYVSVERARQIYKKALHQIAQELDISPDYVIELIELSEFDQE